MEINKDKINTEEKVRIEFCKLLEDWGVEYATEYLLDDCRFDVVILFHNKIVGIIEIKKKETKASKLYTKSKQIQKYEKYNIPVFLLRGMKDLKRGLEFAINRIDIVENYSK